MFRTITTSSRQRTCVLLLTILILGLFADCDIASAKTIYVDSNRAEAANDGSSWQNAYVFLQDAIEDAKRAEKPVEIRVAKGIYKPDIGGRSIIGDRKAAFALISGVTLAGGYAGTKQPDPDIRDIELYVTILSGDLGVNDVYPNDIGQMLFQTDRAENSFNVVIAESTDNTAVIDGFTIASGNADDELINLKIQSAAGGLFCTQGEPVISNCTFTLNAAREGGAIFNYNCNPTIINCTFSTNSAKGDAYGYGGAGGAIVNYSSSPILTNCTFTENYADSGGAIYNGTNSNPVITDCSFVDNYAETKKGGGMNNQESSPVLTNCWFEGNTAMLGGAMYNYESMPVITGCTFSGNTATDQAGGLYNDCSEPNLTGCAFIENSANADGGAIYNESCENIVITDCAFIGNFAYSGGGIYNHYTTDFTFKSCTFTGNWATESAATSNWFSTGTFTNCRFSGNSATFNCAGLLNIANDLTINNCTFADNISLLKGNMNLFEDNIDVNSPIINLPPSYIEILNCIIRDGENTICPDENSTIVVSYSNVAGGWDGVGNIDVDPLFAKPGYWANADDPNIIVEPDDPNAVWIDGDYHLKSEYGRWNPNTQTWVTDDVTSPCIDAGDPNMPVRDEPFPNGVLINMGAYGGTTEASKSYSDIPGVVNVNDSDNGGQVTLRQGQILAVTLESNPTTGYSWAPVEKQNSILEPFGDPIYFPPEEVDGIVGAGGWEIFYFKSINIGQETLDLVYRRSWETDVAPAKTFSIEVTVN